MIITLEFHHTTIRHLLDYIKELYHQPHSSDENQCIYCLDFITKASQVLRRNSKQIKQEKMLTSFERFRDRKANK